MLFSAVLATFVSALAVRAADIRILVGDGGLVFNPSSATAAVGDNVIFEFRAKNHTVTQSTFANPCTPMSAPFQGINSGYNFVPAGTTAFPQWSITVQNASAPLWFFCEQKTPANHCKAGMVFALNPTPEKTFDAFLTNAKDSVDQGPAAPAPSNVASPTNGAPNAGGGAVSGVATSSITALSQASTGAPTAAGLGAAASSTPNGAGALRIGGGKAVGVLAAAVLGVMLL